MFNAFEHCPFDKVKVVILRPDTCLYLSDMGLTKIEHTQPALSDTTADTLRKFTAQEAFVEI